MAKALYRTHRSKSFDEVIGQKHITDTLKNAIAKNAIAHAYLFTGPRGVGKTSVARILAHAVNDLPYTDESSHLDIIEIDAASNRRIDEIRDLREKVHTAPTSARYKVYIIDEVHMLTREAFNALLKTLEEPPEHALFILATTEAHKVPDTIISRTQRFHFKPIEAEFAIQHLSDIAHKEGISITPGGLAMLAKHGRGSFRDSISLLDQLAGLNKEILDEGDVSFLLGIPNQELIDGILEALHHNDTEQLFEQIKTARVQGTDPTQLANTLSQAVRDQLVAGSAVLGAERSIAVLKSLLASSATSDYINLELSLLENMSFSHPSGPVPQQKTQSSSEPQTPKTDAEPKAPVSKTPIKKETPRKTSEPEEQTTTTAADHVPTPHTPTWSWPDLLADMKGHHNTLYGVLRMAHAEMSENEIKLSFQFAFHRQQIESPQHKKTLSEYVSRHFGTINIVTEVANKEKPAESSDTKPTADTDAVNTVSDIFGAAELLE